MEDIFNLKEGISMDIFPRYQNKDIRPTKEASEELVHLKEGLWTVWKYLNAVMIVQAQKGKKKLLRIV